ncbi:NUDIX hydrolase [Labrys wisconsinensis]|uniref:8-oxo-dGTP pyrophosphatase MutT (NUDIX family) n=1 Tax=Labrys wisconsinensis TaxID=425677 RepID=A0ABU0JF30_9HYPH|nr:NUDIX domain-containing protein [Labrys wisconsinensis]MDQ0472883.1 8-oxo-dGTP pyrophosphatase MutT (NUDIX family) [Labrys wisconsinensis]
MLLATVPKAFVYLTRRGRDLLLLAHPDHPDAGLQVPAGTIQTGETPAQAAARELAEETGIGHVGIDDFLGETIYDMRSFGRQELHHRFFYHAHFDGDGPERWCHFEEHAGTAPIRFDLFWWSSSRGLPDLIAGHGDLLHRLSIFSRDT